MNSAPDNAPAPTSELSASSAPKTGLLTVIIHHSITVLILVLFLALGVWAYLNVQATEFFSTIDHDDLEARFYPPLEEAQQQRYETALEVYALRHDRYPTRLDELAGTGLLLPSDLYYPRGPEYWTYDTRGDSYVLQLETPPLED